MLFQYDLLVCGCRSLEIKHNNLPRNGTEMLPKSVPIMPLRLGVLEVSGPQEIKSHVKQRIGRVVPAHWLWF